MEGLEKKKTISEKFPAYMQMYEISGQDPINTHSFERYLKDKESESAIIEAATHSTFSKMHEIEEAPPEEIAKKIEQGIESNDLVLQELCIESIHLAPADKRYDLLVKGLATGNAMIQKLCATMFWCVNGEEIEKLGQKLFILIENGLASDDYTVKRSYAEILSRVVSLNENEILKLKKKVQQILEDGLASNDIEKQKVCADMIWLAPESPPELRIKLHNKFFNIGNVEIKKICASTLWSISTSEDHRYKLIEHGLKDENVEVRKAYAEMIYCLVSEDQILELIKQCLDNPDINVRKIGAEMIAYVSNEKKGILFAEAIKKVGDKIIEPPLYKHTSISKKSFERTGFEKTGSATTLIGGELKDKTIIRHIDPEAFLAWQKLYENYDLWKKEGFDYVPIEQIQSFKLNKNNLIDVYSGVLDLSLTDWERMSNKFVIELRKERDLIREILIRNSIKHGHDDHDGNFCLRFFRDKNGKVDFERKPRLYLIDFDQAKMK